MCRMFKDCGLNIMIEANKKVVDFLDIRKQETINHIKSLLTASNTYTAKATIRQRS